MQIWQHLKTWLGNILTPILGLLLKVLSWIWWPLGKILTPVGWLLLWLARITKIRPNSPWNYLVLVVKPYYVGDEKITAWILTVSTTALMVAEAAALYWLGSQIKQIDDLTSSKNEPEFLKAIIWLAVASIVWTCVLTMFSYVRQWWAAHWRIWSSQMMLRQGDADETIKRLTEEYPELTNLDQRFAQDTDPLFSTIVWLAQVLPQAAVKVAIWLPVLIATSGWLLGGCLVLVAVNLIATVWLGWKLPVLSQNLANSEGDMRTHLQGAIAQARAVALQMSGSLVQAESKKRLAAIYTNVRNIQNVNRNLTFLGIICGQIESLVPKCMIALLFIRGQVSTLGQIGRGVLAFGNVYEGLTVLSREFGGFSTLKAELNRVGPLVAALEAIGENRMPPGDWISYEEGELTFKNVTVFSKLLAEDGKPVVKDLNLAVAGNLMFASRDGQDKSRLAEAIVEGRAHGRGAIQRPSSSQILGVVKPAYLQKSSLRAILTDKCTSAPTDDEILSALRDVSLTDIHKLADGLDQEQEWKTKLSEPDKLMLMLARIILTKSKGNLKLVVVDQATAGLDPLIQAFFFKALRLKEIKFITLSSDVNLAVLHDQVVEIKEDGEPMPPVPGSDFKSPSWKSRFVTSSEIAALKPKTVWWQNIESATTLLTKLPELP